MALADDLSKFARIANGAFNSISANSTAITSMSVGGQTINATSFAGTANNSTNLGGVAAASYALLAGPTFTGNVATGNTLTVGTSAYFVANGNVGIGTSSPVYKLDVYSSSGDALIAARSAASGAGIVRVFGSNTTFAAFNALISNELSGTQQWYLGGDGVANTIIIKNGTSNTACFAANGNFGIGTVSPGSRLDVRGFNGTGLNLTGSTGSFHGIAIGASDASNTVYRGMFIDARNEAGAAIANILCDVNTDGSSNWLFSTQPSGTRTDRRVERMRIAANGHVGIGNTAPTARLHVQGAILASDNITAFSDQRLKKDVSTIENALDKVKQIRGVRYTQVENNSVGIGVIAQEVQPHVPEVVAQNGEYLSVAYGNLTALLIEAIKEQQKQIEALQAQIDIIKR